MIHEAPQGEFSVGVCIFLDGEHVYRLSYHYPLLDTLLEEEVSTELKVLLTLTGTLMSLLKHTTEDPTPGCLSRRHIVKMIYFKL